MDVAATGINAAVVAAVGLILGWLGKGRFEAFDRRFDAVDRRFDAVDDRLERLEQRVEHRIDGLEQRMDRFQGSMDTLRSDLTQVALAVGVRPRATNE